MSLPQKPKPPAPTGTGTLGIGPNPPTAPPTAPVRTLQPPQISRGALQQSLDERIFTPSAVSAVYSTASYATGQSPSAPTLVYPQPPQTMSTQPQNRSPFAAGPRPTHHQFFQRPQIQPPRATIQTSNPSLRPGGQAPTAVYQTNQHIMMVNHLPMPYAMPQGPQYCIPQYRHSAPPYVGPPQQYPVQPPGPAPFYPGPGPGEFPTPYGAPFYSSQPVYQSAPIIVPTQQHQHPPPPAKREKKPIRIRDPNQGGKDITEEIMSGVGSRNSTPPILRPNSTPTPPQQLPSHAPDHSPVVYGTVESPHLPPSFPSVPVSEPKTVLEEKPKAEFPIKSTPPPCVRSEPDSVDMSDVEPTIRPDSTDRPGLQPCVLPVGPSAPIAVPTSQAFPCLLDDTRTSATEESPPAPTAKVLQEVEAIEAEVGISEDSEVPEGPGISPAQEMNGISEDIAAGDFDREKAALGEPPVLAILTATDLDIECVSPSHVPLSSPALSASPQPDSPPPPLIAATGLCTTKTSTSATTLPPPCPQDVAELDDTRTSTPDSAADGHNQGRIEGDIELEASLKLLSFTSRKSPVEALTAPKMWQKPKAETPDAEGTSQSETEPQEEEDLEDKPAELEVDPIAFSDSPIDPDHLYLNKVKLHEENGELEPVHNGAGDISEGEGTDIPSGSEEGLPCPFNTSVGGVGEQPSDDPQETPLPLASPDRDDGKRQYDRDFLLGFQFMPACVQKPEGLPPISDVVLDK
ncbi:hypothetical protein GDO86_020198, partial [Hymenochirus boettgeri]